MILIKIKKLTLFHNLKFFVNNNNNNKIQPGLPALLPC